MTLQQLRYAVEVEKQQSINKAAAVLYTDQSNLGKSITQLEDELGITIFERTTRGVVVTEQGREFLEYARDVTSRIGFIEKTYASRKSFQREHFSVSSMRAVFISDPLIGMLRGGCLKNRNCYLRLKKQSFEDVLRDVETNLSQIGIVFVSDEKAGSLRRIAKARKLEFHELTQSRLNIVLRKGHPLCAPFIEENLREYPYIIAEQSENFERLYDENASSIQKLFENEPGVVISVNDSLICQELTAETDAFFISTTYWQDPATFDSIPLKDQHNLIRHYYVLRKNAEPDDLTRQFISELKVYMRGLIPEPKR